MDVPVMQQLVEATAELRRTIQTPVWRRDPRFLAEVRRRAARIHAEFERAAAAPADDDAAAYRDLDEHEVVDRHDDAPPADDRPEDPDEDEDKDEDAGADGTGDDESENDLAGFRTGARIQSVAKQLASIPRAKATGIEVFDVEHFLRDSGAFTYVQKTQ